jgi:SAM-dependent methyltransferase
LQRAGIRLASDALQHVVRLYEDAFREHGDSPRAVLWPRGRQELRFEALTKHIRLDGGFSVLDYGCGLAHLKPFLDRRYRNVNYTGADAVPAFVDACSKKCAASFVCAESPSDVPGRFDYVVSSGVFNILYEPDESAHRDRVFRMLGQLFEKAEICLAVDFMTDAVDFRQSQAYHQSPSDLLRFASENLSRRLVIDQSYLPYEYALTVWKDARIRRSDGVYE